MITRIFLDINQCKVQSAKCEFPPTSFIYFPSSSSNFNSKSNQWPSCLVFSRPLLILQFHMKKNQCSPWLCCFSSLILINIVWALRKLCVTFRTKTHNTKALNIKIDCRTKTWVSYGNSNRPSIFILFCLMLYVLTSSSSLLFRNPTIKSIFDIHRLIYQECIGKFTGKQHTWQVYP